MHMATPDIDVRPARGRLAALLASRPQRSALLPATGIAAGLLLAALGVFHRAPPDRSAVPAGYAALVNQKGILTSDLIAQSIAELRSEERRVGKECRSRWWAWRGKRMR